MTIETILFLLGMSLLAGILNGIVGMGGLPLFSGVWVSKIVSGGGADYS